MIYVGVLAAGGGQRMHRQDLPKPFLPLGSKPIIVHTLEQFYVNAQVGKVIVVAPRDWVQYTEDLLRRHGTMSTETEVIGGGANKTVSVKMVVDHIKGKWGANDGDIIITHDAVRPFVTQRMIDENIAAAVQYGAASTVMATNDTIVVSEDGETLSYVPPKNRMLAEQTPMTFRLKLLAALFEKAESDGVQLENESELTRLYIAGENAMRLVDGEYSNMKIINPHDLEIAETLLKERKR